MTTCAICGQSSELDHYVDRSEGSERSICPSCWDEHAFERACLGCGEILPQVTHPLTVRCSRCALEMFDGDDEYLGLG